MTIKRDFKSNTRDENTDINADYLPGGRLFCAKYIENTNLRNFLYAFAGEITRVQEKVQELSDEYYIVKTTKLIDKWEKALGVPDACFDIKDKTTDERRLYIRAKLALMNLNTASDFVLLAKHFGFAIDIIPGEANATTFPFTFPVSLFASEKDARFTMIVVFKGIIKPTSIFTLIFPVTFSENKETFLMCLIRKLAPANVHIIYRYQ